MLIELVLKQKGLPAFLRKKIWEFVAEERDNFLHACTCGMINSNVEKHEVSTTSLFPFRAGEYYWVYRLFSKTLVRYQAVRYCEYPIVTLRQVKDMIPPRVSGYANWWKREYRAASMGKHVKRKSKRKRKRV